MSTTIKRIALVAVAALGLGVMTSAPSNAVITSAYGSLIGTSTGQQEVNGFATIVISYDDSITSVTSTGVGTVISAVATTGDATVSAVAANGSFSITDADPSVDTGTVTVTLRSTEVGTQTITMTPFTATGQAGTAITRTVTWVAALSVNTYDKSLAFITGSTGASTSTFLAADTNTSSSATAAINVAATPNASTPVAKIQVRQFAVGDTTTVSTLAAGKGKEVTVAIANAGVLGSAVNAASASTITIPAASYVSGQSQEVWVYADGRTGPGTITVTVNGVAVATKTVTFTGTTTKYAVGTATGDALSAKFLAPTGTATVKFNGLDSLNNLSDANPTVANAITSDATVATATVSGNTITITGVKAGTAKIYAANASTLATATIVSPAIDVEVTSATAATVTFSFDKPAYQPGEKITLSVNAVTSTGRPVADGARALLKETATANMSLIGSLPLASVTLVNGKADYVLFAPSTSGDLVISATEGTGTSSTTKAAIAGGTVAVTNAGLDAALDAANEAATAAQDATDAAIQAADAADEATAAVAALQLEVNTLIAGLKKQLTTLTNLVKNLAKAVAKK